MAAAAISGLAHRQGCPHRQGIGAWLSLRSGDAPYETIRRLNAALASTATTIGDFANVVESGARCGP